MRVGDVRRVPTAPSTLVLGVAGVRVNMLRVAWCCAAFVVASATGGVASGASREPPLGPTSRQTSAVQSFPGPACLATPALISPVACENTAPGSPPSEWDVPGSGDPSIQGFTTDISADHGQSIFFKVKTDASQYHIEIYRLGYYGGLGARKVAVIQPTVALPQAQPPCLFDPSTQLLDCGNWLMSAAWNISDDAVSGVYVAKLVRDAGHPGASQIVFVVRDDERRSDLLFQTSDATWQVYNTYGGVGGYTLSGSPPRLAVKMSYNRPLISRNPAGGQGLFQSEYPMLRWLEANGYDVSYASSIDADRFGSHLTNHRVVLSVGHDEYWSGTQRANVEAARDAGINLAFFSGDEMFWKTRYENDYRTLVTYKESVLGLRPSPGKLDPSSQWTGMWRDPRFSPPADGGRPENALSGTLYANQSSGSITVPADEGRFRFWRNTSIATLSPGTTATLPFGTLGYEWDEAVDTGGVDQLIGVPPARTKFQPAGLIYLSTTTPAPTVGAPENDPELNGPQLRYRSKSTAGTAAPTHHLTLYRAPSGALVFSAGTVQWSWGLDGVHDGAATPTDPQMRQATANLLTDMGAQPRTPQPGLVVTAPSTNMIPPVTTIDAPAPATVLHVGQGMAVTGTATAHGIVAAVDVSTDGGQTWTRATGTDHWMIFWTPSAPGPVTILARATDDSANLEQPGAKDTVTVQ